MHLRPEGGRQHLTARHPERAIEVLPARRRRLEAQAAGSRISRDQWVASYIHDDTERG